MFNMGHTMNGRSAQVFVLWCCSILLLLYAIVRAATVTFTYDECFTFLEHVRVDLFYLRHHDQMGANHHLLNVWCMWVGWKVFGDGELALRLPSLLAYALYLYATARIALRARTGLLVVGAFLLFNLHPYLIDFFSLARGYALAHAFMMLSLWQGVRYVQEGMRTWVLVRAISFAALAALANLVMVNFLLAISAALACTLLFARRNDARKPWRELGVMASINALCLLLVLPNALGLFHGGSLYFGCDAFWSCTVYTLAEKLVYMRPMALGPSGAIGVVLFCCAVVSVFVVSRKGVMAALRPSFLGATVLALCLLAFFMQQWLFAVPLPRARTALFLLPLTVFVVVSALQAWSRWTWIPGTLSFFGVVPLAFLSYHSFNTSYAVEWRSTGDMRKALDHIAADRRALTSERPQVLVRAGFETMGSMVYYANKPDRRWLAYGLRSDTAFQAADYYLVVPVAQHLVDPLSWTEVFRSEHTGLTLYRDQRMTNTFSRLVFRGTWTKPKAEQHPTSSIGWIVPHDIPAVPTLITGSVSALEHTTTNWVGMILQVWRGSELIAEESLPSHPQVLKYGSWNESYVTMLRPDGLLPGDSVAFLAGPCYRSPAITMATADLRVMH